LDPRSRRRATAPPPGIALCSKRVPTCLPETNFGAYDRQLNVMFNTIATSSPQRRTAPRRQGTRRGLERLRPVADPFDIGETPGPPLHDAAAEAVAESISSTIGTHHPAIDEYLPWLGYAPVEHLSGLAARGARIFFAPTVAHYLLSSEADRRRLNRGCQPVSAREHATIEKGYGARSGVLAAYDAETDVLVLPYMLHGPDKLQAALHELGHAVTHRQLRGREDRYAHVLGKLPSWIRRHLDAGYPAEMPVLVHETFAEAYAMLVAGRVEELGVIASELIGILTQMGDPQERRDAPTWKMDPASGRSASLVDPGSVLIVGPIPDPRQPLPVQPTGQAREAAAQRRAA
jgi:hypothetical protein